RCTRVVESELHVVETIGNRSTCGIEQTTLEVHGGGGGGDGGSKDVPHNANNRTKCGENGDRDLAIRRKVNAGVTPWMNHGVFKKCLFVSLLPSLK
ncbi:MAG: hypothetical protein WAU02_02740, partial [Candidatus Saccharimonadales bacterium]